MRTIVCKPAEPSSKDLRLDEQQLRKSQQYHEEGVKLEGKGYTRAD